MSTEEAVLEEEIIEEEGSPFALLFELEFIALEARKATFELFQSLLSDSGVKLNPVQFSRYCLHPSPSFAVPALLESLEGKLPNEDKLIDDVSSGLAMYYSSGEAVLRPELKTFLDIARERNVDVGAMSCQDDQAASALIEKIGLDPDEIPVFAYSAGKHTVFPRADMWLKITKTLGKSPRNCVALVSSATSAKSALSSGMRCIALPDAYTGYQDFGGADAVIDSLADADLNELADLVFPAVQ